MMRARVIAALQLTRKLPRMFAIWRQVCLEAALGGTIVSSHLMQLHHQVEQNEREEKCQRLIIRVKKCFSFRSSASAKLIKVRVVKALFYDRLRHKVR